MADSLIELGHFGGWANKGIVDSVSSAVSWGDPMARNVEITPTDDTTAGFVYLKLPDEARVTVGAEYNIFVYNNMYSGIAVGPTAMTCHVNGALLNYSSDFQSSGFEIGMTVTVSGFPSPGNNSDRVIASFVPQGPTGEAMVFTSSSGMVSEAGDGDELVVLINTNSTTKAKLQIQDYGGTNITRPDTSNLLIDPSIPGQGEMITMVYDGSNWVISGPYMSGSPDKTAEYTKPTNDGSYPTSGIVIDLYQDVANLVAANIASSNGYNGTDGYRIVLRCHNMTIGSSSKNAFAFSTGIGWGLNCSVHLELINSTVSGFGGFGGSTAAGGVEVAPGDGGGALAAFIPLLVIADDTSRITAGGGGGPTNALQYGGGGGNGGNMTSGGALVGSVGGSGDPGVVGGYNGSEGGIVDGGLSGGALAFNGANWGGGVTGGSFSSYGGWLAASQGETPITWSVTPGFRWGKNGTATTLPALPETVSF